MNKNVAVIAVVGALMLGMTAVAGAADPKGEFVGSAKCKSCHSEEYKSWKDSWHSKMVRPKKEAILKEVVEKWATDGTEVGPSTGNVTKSKFKLEDVKYVVGSRWKQRFLVANDQTGGMQFLDRQFNRYTSKWEKYGNANDWNTNCGTCHTTGYRILEYDEKFGKHGRTVKDSYSEMGVGCEACHGPGNKHVASKKADKKKTIFNPANVDTKAQSKVCGYCHIRIENEKFMTAQGNPREDLPAPKVGDSYKAGDDWTKWYPELAIIPGVHADQPVNKEYVGDLKGLFKLDDHAKANGIFEEAKHHQQYQGFLQSKHYQNGEMSCITCCNVLTSLMKTKPVCPAYLPSAC